MVKDLYSRYDTWWEDISDAFDKYAKVQIGTESQNPVRFFEHDSFFQLNNGQKIPTMRLNVENVEEVS